MTTVNRIGGGQVPARSQGVRTTSTGFRLPATGGSDGGAAKVGDIAGVGATLGLLGIQAAGDALESNARAKRDGMAALGDLRSLQLALIEGRDPGVLLERLECLPFSEAADPALREIVDEVRARVRVEAARREALRRRQEAELMRVHGAGGQG